MNSKQARYLSEVAVNRTDTLGLAIMGVSLYNMGFTFPDVLSSSLPDQLLFISSAGCLALTGAICKEYFKKRVKLYRNQRFIQRHKSLFPLEFATKVKINDAAGLEGLLIRTAEKEKLEWGTVFRAYEDQGTAVINNILDSREAEAQGFVTDREKDSICFNFLKMRKNKYNGLHHYHPVGLSTNYSLGLADRLVSPGIDILTFNLSDGPEIIGYNSRHVYIPADKSKRELVQATFGDIWNYLK